MMKEEIERALEGLKQRQFDVRYAENAEEAKRILAEYIVPDARVAAGGSITMEQLGLADLVKEREAIWLDRNEPGLSAEQRLEVCRAQMTCDLFCCSSNAITEDGQLLNIDGTGNRVASMTFGPRKVVIVAGSNKIVPDLQAAQKRLQTVVAPGVSKRLQRKTPCVKTGRCMDCKSPERICRAISLLAAKPVATDMTVILVGEPLGL